MSPSSLITTFCLISIIFGSIYAVLFLARIIRVFSKPSGASQHTFSEWPSVSILKPICGLEKISEDIYLPQPPSLVDTVLESPGNCPG